MAFTMKTMCLASMLVSTSALQTSNADAALPHFFGKHHTKADVNLTVDKMLDPECACLSWQDARVSKWVRYRCQVEEDYAEGPGLVACHKFFGSLVGNICVNEKDVKSGALSGEAPSEQYCYVF